MRMMSLCCTLICAAIPAACQPAEPQDFRKPSESDRQACVAEGGTYERGGRLGAYICFRPLEDAGKSCSKASDCAGFCLSETKQCSAVTPQFGCIPHLNEAGTELVICID